MAIIDDDKRNVADCFKGWHEDLIKESLVEKSFPYAVLMGQIQGDFNFGSLVRNANGFAAREVFYFGKRKFDPRGAVGTHHYTKVQHLTSEEELLALQERYSFVGIENNVSSAVSLHSFDWETEKDPLIIFGEEGCGISESILSLCEKIVYIPMFGSVRSFNVSSSSAVIMNDLIVKKKFCNI